MVKIVLRLFFRGLLIVAPATITVYLLLVTFDWLNRSFDAGVPGVGIALVFGALTMLGWIGTSPAVRPLLSHAERLVFRVPLVGTLYTSVRDMFDALMGDNLRFNQPVLVQLTEDSQAYKIGFVTQEELSRFGLPEMAAVYFPDAYDYSGELLLVPRRFVHPLDLPSTEMMKFVVSGGVARV